MTSPFTRSLDDITALETRSDAGPESAELQRVHCENNPMGWMMARERRETKTHAPQGRNASELSVRAQLRQEVVSATA